jgi:DNA-binding protein HU-beta
MNKAELLEALQKQTRLRPTHVKRVVDAIFDPEDGVISRQIKRGGKVTIAGFGTFDRRTHKAREVNSVFTGRSVKVKARKIPGFRAGVSFKEAMK